MKATTINTITTKLKVLSQESIDDVLHYIDYISFKDSQKNFRLTSAQKKILVQRSKTPIEKFVPAEKVIASLKKKFNV